MDIIEEFDFGFAKVNVTITGVKGYKTDKNTGDQYPFVNAVFLNENGLKTVHQCRQENPMEDVIADVNMIHSGKIAGTKFYKHWIKLFFKDREEVTLLKKDDFLILQYVGKYNKQDSFKEKTFYFTIDGKKEKIKGYCYEYKGKQFQL